MAEDSRWSISACGLNCAKCDMNEACHGNEAKRNQIVEWFREVRNETVKPEQIVCEGCRGPLASHWSPECGMMLCTREKGLTYCFECEDFPCAIVDEFASNGISHHGRTVENMKRMKEIGLEAWIEEQERAGRCVFCPG